MNREFDYQNGRDDVPSSFLRADQPDAEDTAPTCRGYWSNGVLVPLSRDDDQLAEIHDVPSGTTWRTEHDWAAERRMYLRGNRVHTLEPDHAARVIGLARGEHCHWDAERRTFVLWPLRDWERTGEALSMWAENFERETGHGDRND